MNYIIYGLVAIGIIALLKWFDYISTTQYYVGTLVCGVVLIALVYVDGVGRGN